LDSSDVLGLLRLLNRILVVGNVGTDAYGLTPCGHRQRFQGWT